MKIVKLFWSRFLLFLFVEAFKNFVFVAQCYTCHGCLLIGNWVHKFVNISSVSSHCDVIQSRMHVIDGYEPWSYKIDTVVRVDGATPKTWISKGP